MLSAVLSFLIPLLNIRLSVGNSQTVYSYLLETIVVSPDELAVTLKENMNLYKILATGYIAGTAFFLLRFLFILGRLSLLISKNGHTVYTGVKIIFTHNEAAPYSFFNMIFLGSEITDHKKLEIIVLHEQVHIRQKHSVDLLILELISIFQWYNPFIWFYKTSLKSLHEFLADRGVLQEGISKVEYQAMLVNQTFEMQLNYLFNSFNHSLIKRRFFMMSKSKTNRIALLKMILVFPLAIALTVLFSITVSERITAQENPVKSTSEVSKQEIQEQDQAVFTVVEKMPRFPGGDEARIKYMVENIRYPEAARKNGIKGTVYISFIVEKDGKISTVKVIRGIGGGCDEEAFRVIQNMPYWEPGKQKGEPVRTILNIPIKFDFKEDVKKPEQNHGTEENQSSTPSEKK
jgi:TonB family protein